MEIVKDYKILKEIEKASGNSWKFNKVYKYYIGNTYTKIKQVNYKNNTYILQYFSGCFFPYCVKL